MDKIRPLVLGHRGAPLVSRENTLDAFHRARELGADGVELDARLTNDGMVVVHHDPALPDDHVSNLGIIRRSDRGHLPDWVPSLTDSLDELSGLFVNVELKDLPGEPGWDPAEPLAHAVAELLASRDGRHGPDHVLVSSFSLNAIDTFARLRPGTPTAWLTGPGYDHHSALVTAAEHGHSALNPFHADITQELVDAAAARGMGIHAWTVDEPARMRELASWGVASIITNDVATAVANLL